MHEVSSGMPEGSILISIQLLKSFVYSQLTLDAHTDVKENRPYNIQGIMKWNIIHFTELLFIF